MTDEVLVLVHLVLTKAQYRWCRYMRAAKQVSDQRLSSERRKQKGKQTHSKIRQDIAEQVTVKQSEKARQDESLAEFTFHTRRS